MATEKEKINIRNIMLRIISVLAVNAFIYAGFIMLRAFIFQDDGGVTAAILYTAYVCLAFASGILSSSLNVPFLKRAAQTKFFRFVAFMLNIRDSERFILSSVIWGLIIVPAAVTFIFYGKLGLIRSIFELLPAATAYIVSLKQSRLSPARIMNGASISTGMFIMVISLELPHLVKRLIYLRPLYFMISYFILFAFLIVKNQEDIDKQIFSKKHIDKSVLPKNLRRFNLMLVCFVFFITLLLFNLKTVVVYILNIAKQIISFVILFFLQLFDKLMTVTPSGEQLTQESIGAMYGQRPMPFLNLFTNVLKYFLILYLAYKLLFAIAVRIPGAISKIVEILRKFLRIERSTETYAESDFVDMTETVLPDVRNKFGEAKKKKARLKKLNQISDPAEKVRRMYGNILGMLPLRGVTPERSDTTSEILAKAAGTMEVQDGLSPFTAMYDQVRYGDVVPDRDMLARAQTYYEGLLMKGDTPSAIDSEAGMSGMSV